ncbi:fucose-binding lectin II [Streptomyces sp. NPDC051567]|uniref:fucose-binding lectin II n=1 Tax=Streptomyces sp. NPDC051567 TaxID=3365660 RepID=UPI0037AA5381
MADAHILIKGNTAQIGLPGGLPVHVKAKTSSRFIQTVKVTSADGSVDLRFTGSGERVSIGDATITGQSQITATFEYNDSDGTTRPSALRSGGPYQIGSYNLMVVVAENGDDTDYNDSLLEFSWHTPR